MARARERALPWPPSYFPARTSAGGARPFFYICRVRCTRVPTCYCVEYAMRASADPHANAFFIPLSIHALFLPFARAFVRLLSRICPLRGATEWSLEIHWTKDLPTRTRLDLNRAIRFARGCFYRLFCFWREWNYERVDSLNRTLQTTILLLMGVERGNSTGIERFALLANFYYLFVSLANFYRRLFLESWLV